MARAISDRMSCSPRLVLKGHAIANVKQGITILPFRSSRFKRPSTRILSTFAQCLFYKIKFGSLVGGTVILVVVQINPHSRDG
ncbi:hypothetical protein AGR7C_Cc60026 [Agrobacterium deltaense Zutra 3/1]|uniref:Uncharacterized protein n=1 Tax=Agrobacterium deltaense Zutra 3/1 TaxID=1183427 RepID=A0A1S7QJV8_9HYPH|nr:hypothetical protein AGR7C_Cc60026 [Agrobacterium deltaense Zutra 3/1]